MTESTRSPTGTEMVPNAVAIRAATRDDAPVIAAIYNEGIRGRGATFETEERTADHVRSWLEAPDARRYPFLVAEHGQAGVLGWIRASAYRPRACYASVAEFSVYVALPARGRGVGDALMDRFIAACGDTGLTKLVSRVFPENMPSRALCARHGFREVGMYEKHAQLDGVWRDVVIVERLLDHR